MSDIQSASPDSINPAKRAKSRRILAPVLIPALLALLGFVGFPFHLHSMSHESTDDAYLESHMVNISPRVADHMATVRVKDNSLVKTGQVLTTLDPRDYQVELDVAMARLESVKASVTEAKAAVSAARNVIDEKWRAWNRNRPAWSRHR